MIDPETLELCANKIEAIFDGTTWYDVTDVSVNLYDYPSITFTQVDKSDMVTWVSLKDGTCEPLDKEGLDVSLIDHSEGSFKEPREIGDVELDLKCVRGFRTHD